MVPLAMTPTNVGTAFSRTFNNPLPPPALEPTLPSVDILDATPTPDISHSAVSPCTMPDIFVASEAIGPRAWLESSERAAESNA